MQVKQLWSHGCCAHAAACGRAGTGSHDEAWRSCMHRDQKGKQQVGCRLPCNTDGTLSWCSGHQQAQPRTLLLLQQRSSACVAELGRCLHVLAKPEKSCCMSRGCKCAHTCWRRWWVQVYRVNVAGHCCRYQVLVLRAQGHGLAGIELLLTFRECAGC
jgi:hypothetical protein